MIAGANNYLTTLTLEYFHMVQILGLMLFSIYPREFSVNMYSYLHGINFLNLEFVYNAPKQMM